MISIAGRPVASIHQVIRNTDSPLWGERDAGVATTGMGGAQTVILSARGGFAQLPQ
jgi:hypothetical protein